ncbi:MAG: DnaJ domain-containing protein [Spirochaetia bacterium]|jgi:curved DNA-binding protein CbpA|uniref:Chaperone protein DnaJ n=1 Tax=bioreactor metagenome TaxID=1076179 RepID=A0A644SX00_9ZZZZ|nr:DnaJ domain-containing protein [Spirochaetia bacterium]MCE1209520.1 DnaJ domain-containing protein [Spirochaetia bacterium]MDD3821110.1 DnaJ domain-containing protein [Spirochaetales bacterium]NLX45420.1 DnaJ domain-containing protein [Treponema sp.]VBB39436.1 Molecular chaperone protein [uncultured Spirochaetota bacterium]
MENYYEVLGVPPDSNQSAIKSAFRKKAKKYHPDMEGPVRDEAGTEESGSRGRHKQSSAPVASMRESAMRLILEAYRILSDAEKRRAYDRSLRRQQLEQGGFDYRIFLKSRSFDPESQAKLILFDLLHNLEDEAIAVYERSKSFGDFRLERWIDRGEAMDAEYCLAEEYEKRGRLLKAYGIYKRLVVMEQEKAWFRYYFDVVALKFRTLLLQKMPGRIDEDDYLDRLEEAIQLDIGIRDSAQFLRKKAEVHLRRKEWDQAKEALEKASLLVPKLPGLGAVKKRLLEAGY